LIPKFLAFLFYLFWRHSSFLAPFVYYESN
jgi:hypothetical protein